MGNMHRNDLSGIYQGIERRQNPVDKLEELLKSIKSSIDDVAQVSCTINNHLNTVYERDLWLIKNISHNSDKTSRDTERIFSFTNKLFNSLKAKKLRLLLHGKRMKF